MEKIKWPKPVSRKEIWEILVPTVRTDGRPIKKRFHKVWDEKVIEITGGLTVLTPAKGAWLCPEGKLFEERMIPVRIACTRDEMEKVVSMTIDYYDQKAILAYRISDEVILRYADASS